MITNEQIETLEHLARYATAHDHETAALRAAIDTLETMPVTRDGVRMSVGMNVSWFCEVTGCVRHNVGVAIITIEQLGRDEFDAYVTLRDGDGEEWECNVADIYSTRSAALAAIQKSAMQGQIEAGSIETSVK